MNTSNPGKKSLPQPVIDTALQGWARAGRQSTFTVSGDSMHPIIHHGDVLVIMHGIQHFRPGDLLAFRQGEVLTVHRLLRVLTQSHGIIYQTKGDNCRQPDALISQQQVVGVVRSLQRGSREINLQTPVWRAAGELIAASGRLGLRLDGLGLRVKRMILGSAPNPITTNMRRAIAWLADLPARIINWLFWGRS